MKPQVTMYTDGSANPNDRIGGWAVLLLFKDKQKEIFGGREDTTCNQMEFVALLEGLKLLKMPCRVMAHTDSQLLIQYMNNARSKNTELMWLRQEITREIKEGEHELCFVKVAAHSGNKLNSRVDALAKNAASSIRAQRSGAF